MKFSTKIEAEAFVKARDRVLGFPKVTSMGEFATAAPLEKVGKEWETSSCAADLRANGHLAITELQPDGAADDWVPRVWELDDDLTLPAHTKAAHAAKAERETALLAMTADDVLAVLAPAEVQEEPEDPLVLALAKSQEVSLDVAREVAAKVRASEAEKAKEREDELAGILDEAAKAEKSKEVAGD